jgi:hypothetical protein
VEKRRIIVTQQRMTDPTGNAGDVERLAAGHSSGLVGDFIYFLKNNKKWWLIPLILILVLVGVLVIVGSTAAAPFIYTLF